MRAKGVSIGGSSNWVCLTLHPPSHRSYIISDSILQLNNFAVATATSPFLDKSALGAFIFFGCVTTIGILYVIFLVPETRGRTLEEMDELFGTAGMAAADAARKARIESEIGLLALVGVESPESEKKIEEVSHSEDYVRGEDGEKRM